MGVKAIWLLAVLAATAWGQVSETAIVSTAGGRGTVAAAAVAR